MKTVNFAILGCGKIGTRHAEKMRGLDYVRLVAVCDVVPERANELALRHVCRAYTSLDELLKDPEVDFVNICTPSGLHPEHAITSLKGGKHVLCEKPMALTVADAMAMVQTAKAANRLLYIIKQNRYNPPIKLVNQLLADGKLGAPIMCAVNMYWNRNDAYYASDPWRGTLALDGGTIYTQASHFVDLMLHFMGPPKTVYARMGTMNHEIEIEDTGTIVTEFQNGAFGSMNYTTCATKKNFEGSITLFFTKGTIKIGGEYINTIEHFAVEGIDGYQLEEAAASANDYGTYRGSMSNHHEVFQDILRHMNDEGYNGSLVYDREGIETIRFIEGALASARTGGVIDLSAPLKLPKVRLPKATRQPATQA
ncbi:Gfo/Idh/MocA family oxidoreductase [Candidatus Berkelbacteria bacterium]|nr:Gfo/Idh/MocA family oxidoreductase [Candidatus Berkelbacteria bacterium]